MKLQSKLIQSTNDLCIEVLEYLQESDAVVPEEIRLEQYSRIRKH